MTASAYAIFNEQDGNLVIRGGVFAATDSEEEGDPCVIYNQGGTCTIEGGEFDSPGPTFMNVNGASMTINGGEIITTSVRAPYALCAAQNSTNVTVNGGWIESINVVNGANATVNGGTVVNEHGWYAVYSGRDHTNYGTVAISGGYFCGADGYVDIYSMSRDNVQITGGYFEDNKATLADGYTYQSNVQEIDGITYNYEVVPQL